VKGVGKKCLHFYGLSSGYQKVQVDNEEPGRNMGKTLHAFDFVKYAQRYLGAFQYRFNRRFNLAGLLKRLLFAAVRTKRRSESALRSAED